MKFYEKAAAWWAKKLQNSRMVPSKKVKQFKKDLAFFVKDEVITYGEVHLTCDYRPFDLLADVANRYDIPWAAFPPKAVMKITAEKVEVADGYQASYTTL